MICRSSIFNMSHKVGTFLVEDLHPEDDRNSAVVSAKIYQEIEKTDLAASFREFDPFQLGQDDAERKSNKKLLLKEFEEGEKAYELLL